MSIEENPDMTTIVIIDDQMTSRQILVQLVRSMEDDLDIQSFADPLEALNWTMRNQYQMAGPPVEIYWSDPEKVPAEDCLTEIWFPVFEKPIPGGVVK